MGLRDTAKAVENAAIEVPKMLRTSLAISVVALVVAFIALMVGMVHNAN